RPFNGDLRNVPDYKLEFYSGTENQFALSVVMSDLPSFETDEVRVSITPSSSIASVLRASVSFLSFHRRTTGTTVSQSVVIWALFDTVGNGTLDFVLSGPAEYQNGQRISLPINVLPLLKFDAKLLKPEWPIGTPNYQVFWIRPVID